MNPARSWDTWRADAAAILSLAWPVFVGQVAVLGFATVDTVLAGRIGPQDLAALAIGSAIYISVFVGLSGTMLALSPLAGRLQGAGRRRRTGAQLHQSLWLALALCVPGVALLCWPAPFLWLTDAPPVVAGRAQAYLRTLAFAVPAGLVFTGFRAFNTALARPRAVMALQVGALLLKGPLSAALALGVGPVPALGVVGCAWATVVVLWLQALGGWAVLLLDRFYRPYHLPRRRLQRPHLPTLRRLLRLGLPIAASMLIEVTGFTFMALFIARLGTLAVAGHQIAANITGLLFMMPLSLANACATRVAQAIGAGELAAARRLGWHGVELALSMAVAAALVLWWGRPAWVAVYTHDAPVAAIAVSLLAWVALYHLADAAQTMAAYVLRSWHVTTVPMLIYAFALWGIGLAGGYGLAFGPLQTSLPSWASGAAAFWCAATIALAGAAAALVLLLRGRVAQA